MITRFMRIILFFDLPTISNADKKHYRIFMKGLVQEGFLQMQESVYTKLVLNRTSVELAINRIKSYLPPKGLVQVLVVTEKQFASIQNILGDAKNHNEIDSVSRLVIL